MLNTSPKKHKCFDQIVRSRLYADDFAQPKTKDSYFYKNKAIQQIDASVSTIMSATNQYEFTIAIAQANAFINAAIDYEFIDLSEKSEWLSKIANAMREQLIEEIS